MLGVQKVNYIIAQYSLETGGVISKLAMPNTANAAGCLIPWVE